MGKKTTALQDLIEWAKSKETEDQYNGLIYKMVFKATELLEKEKDSIRQAYGDGLNAHRTNFSNRDEYFNNTYK